MTKRTAGGEINRVQTYVARDGRQLGNYGDEQLRSLYERGHLLPSDYYWRDGMSEWSTLGELLPPLPVVKPAPRPVEADDDARPGWLIPVLSVGGALMVGLAILAFIVYHYHQKMVTRRVMDEMKTFVAAQQLERKSGGGRLDPQQFSTEMKKLEDLSKGQSSNDRILTEETVLLLQQVSTRGQACRNAEKDMLALGFTPAKLTSVEEIDKRRAAIESALPTLHAMVDYISQIDTTIHSDLVKKGVPSLAADNFIAGMHRSGKTESLLTYWKQEAAISSDLLANLDLLKQNYGDWHVEGDKVLFNDGATLTIYQANVAKLKTDIATQQQAQQAVQRAGP